MNYEGHLLNDPDRVGRLIANHLFLCYSFVISCLSRTNQTWFDVNGGTLNKNEFNLP